MLKHRMKSLSFGNPLFFSLPFPFVEMLRDHIMKLLPPKIFLSFSRAYNLFLARQMELLTHLLLCFDEFPAKRKCKAQP